MALVELLILVRLHKKVVVTYYFTQTICYLIILQGAEDYSILGCDDVQFGR